MNGKINTWDIVKIIEIPESLKKFQKYCSSDKGWHINIRKKGSWGSGSVFMPEHIVGKEFYVNNNIGSTYLSTKNNYRNSKQTLYNLVSVNVTNGGTFLGGSGGYILPREVLKTTGRRVLDVRALKHSHLITARSKLFANEKFMSISCKTADPKLQSTKSIENLRKFTNIYFPNKKDTIKNVMLQIMRTMNQGYADYPSCFSCGWCVDLQTIAARRYFRKGSGGTTYKCEHCKRTNFIVLNFRGQTGGIFVFSQFNEHIE